MPVIHFHLPKGSFEPAKISRLVVEASTLYAETLACPIDRVRAMAHLVDPDCMAVGGRLISEGGLAAPCFEFLVLEGRPLGECRRLLSGFTRLVVDVLGADASTVRGACWPIAPEHWGIAGLPASQVRQDEIRSRLHAAMPHPDA